MNYYSVWVSSTRYKKNEPLTYSSELKLKVGQIVVVPVQNYLSLGLIEAIVDKPSFATKPIDRLVSDKPVPLAQINLFKWIQSYYPAPASSHLQLFLPKSLLGKSELIDKKTTKAKPLPLPDLTTDQSSAISKINNSENRVVILHGDTGTGKTRVYIELVKQQFSQGRSAIILIPEIGLTPQLFKTLNEAFPNQIISIHSGLTPKDRQVRWLNILNATDPVVVVGPRSSLFAPINNLGLIVVDEAHEAVYKQEQSPYYQTSRVAAKLAELTKSKIIFGTATPSVSDYYLMQSKQALVVRMTKQAKGVSQSEPDISLVKLNDRSEFSKSSWLSDKLLAYIKDSLSKGEQTLIFLNRRGTALLVLCSNCGWQALCPNCDSALTYHADSHSMRCHSCSYNHQVPSSCPVCQNTDLVFRGAGTKAISEDLARLFPGANISRFDKDNRRGEKLDENYSDLLSGKIDIVVGTQIITKGFDLPKLSTVGVVMADSSLYFPDYTAEEKTFQTITQIIGRVSRGHRDGRVVIQTYHPDSQAIADAISKNYQDFYARQLEERAKYNFPPFCYVLKVSCKRASIKSAQAAISKVASLIKQAKLPVKISGPSPSFYEKIRGQYSWQLIIRSSQRQALVEAIKLLPTNYNYDIDPINLL